MKTIASYLTNAHQEIPDQIAIHLLQNRMPDQAISYRQLLQGSLGFSHALQKAGVRPGEVVLLILKHGADLIHSFFGAILQAAIPSIMPFLTEKLSTDRYHDSLAALFEITLPAAVITYPEFVGEVRKAANASVPIRAILTSDDIQPLEITNFEDLLGLRRSPEDIALLQHSSGTTGLQKGVALSHRSVFNQLESYTKALHLSTDDVIVSWLPLYHDMGLIAGFLLPVLSRVPLVLMSPFDWVRAPYKLMRAISDYRGTLCWLPNFAYNFCAQKIRDRDLEGVDLSSWRAVINCSEPTYWQSHEMFVKRFYPYGFRQEALATSYALAENVFAVTQGGIDSPVNVDFISQNSLLNTQTAKPVHGEVLLDQAGIVKMLSAGRPIENTSLRILDARGKDLPERHIGEIAIQSNCLLTGYYNRPDLTEKTFLDGWYLTGDLGYLSGEELYITGRKKDLIIVGGKNIHPQDLERLAGEVPGVYPGRVAAFGVFNQQTGTEDVVIVAEVDDEDPEVQQTIANEIRTRVTRGSDVALRYVEIVERNWLQKTSSGKVARGANRKKYLIELEMTMDPR